MLHYAAGQYFYALFSTYLHLFIYSIFKVLLYFYCYLDYLHILRFRMTPLQGCYNFVVFLTLTIKASVSDSFLKSNIRNFSVLTLN